METRDDRQTLVRTMDGKPTGVTYRRALPLPAAYPGFAPGRTVEDGVLIERDVEVVLSDGTKIYTDVFRSAEAVGVPAIVAWSPYGKGGGGTFDDFPGRGGVPEGIPSAWAKVEMPDQAYWCRQGLP